MITILGIDIGTRYTGYSIVTYKDSITTAELGVHEFKESFPQRLVEAESLAEYLIKEYSPDVIAAENYGYGGGFFNREVPELFGQLKRVFHVNRKPLVLIAPNSAKKAVTGSGKATKVKVRNSVVDTLKKEGAQLILDPKVSKDVLNHATDSLAMVLALLKSGGDSPIMRDFISILKYYRIKGKLWKLSPKNVMNE